MNTIEDIKTEFNKCKNDPIHFISDYIKVVHPILGLTPFKLYPFQKRIVNELEGNKILPAASIDDDEFITVEELIYRPTVISNVGLAVCRVKS